MKYPEELTSTSKCGELLNCRERGKDMVRLVNGVPHYSLSEYHQMMSTDRSAADPEGTMTIRSAGKPASPEVVRPVNKYRNKKTEVDGHVFDSKLEAERYRQLKLMKISGLIAWFQLQPSFTLTGAVRYRPDFIVMDQDGNIWLEDAKGKETKEFIIKKKQFAAIYPGLDLRIIKRGNIDDICRLVDQVLQV